jgi:uncharacterized protein YcaQ
LARRELISAAEARGAAIAAQGFAARPLEAVGPLDLKRLTRRLGVIQIDSVNVLVRSHYLPIFARLGSYAPALLDAAAYDGKRRHLFEYWGHEASLLPVENYRLFRWRMAAAEKLERIWSGLAKTKREQQELIDRVLEQVRSQGPIGASQIEGSNERGGPWWGWSDGKRALEFLFWAGQLTTAARRNFERLYDLPERVLPRAALQAPVPDREAAQRELVLIAAQAQGVATEQDLRDYFRLSPRDSKQRVAELVEAGLLLPVSVKGWSHPAYLHPSAKFPRRIDACALLSPFDNLVWERARTERLWQFRYRIEIYTPGPKRVHGYYVLPFLLGDALVGRVDLKSDRAARVLRVMGAHTEAGVDTSMIAPRLHQVLNRMSSWLGLDRIEVTPRGDLAETLARHHAAPPPREA